MQVLHIAFSVVKYGVVLEKIRELFFEETSLHLHLHLYLFRSK